MTERETLEELTQAWLHAVEEADRLGKKCARLENALRIAVEHLMVFGAPKENLGQFLFLVQNALECEDEEIERCRRRYNQAEGKR